MNCVGLNTKTNTGPSLKQLCHATLRLAISLQYLKLKRSRSILVLQFYSRLLQRCFSCHILRKAISQKIPQSKLATGAEITVLLVIKQDYQPYRLGSWQFMADMPYMCVSSGAMWQLSWVLHQSQGQVAALPDVSICKAYVKGTLCKSFT